MKLQELIELLEGIADEHGDIEVRLASQPSWPFEYAIPHDHIVAVVPADDDEFELEDESTREVAQETVCYIGEGRQLGYLSSSATNALGWGRQ